MQRCQEAEKKIKTEVGCQQKEDSHQLLARRAICRVVTLIYFSSLLSLFSCQFVQFVSWAPIFPFAFFACPVKFNDYLTGAPSCPRRLLSGEAWGWVVCFAWREEYEISRKAAKTRRKHGLKNILKTNSHSKTWRFKEWGRKTRLEKL